MKQDQNSRLLQKKNVDKEWIHRARGNSSGSRFFIWIISRFGLLPAYTILIFACVYYLFFDNKSKMAIKKFRKNIGVNCGPLTYYGHFFSFGMALIDRYYFFLSSRNYFRYTFNNEDYIVRETDAGKGVILLGAHIGNWEIAGNLLQERINKKVNFLMYDAESEDMKQTVQKIAKKRNVHIIYVKPDAPDAMVEVVNALRRGEIVCLHGDRLTSGMRFEKMKFLNVPAKFPFGAFAIASISGAPVIPFFAVKEGIIHYKFSASQPIYIEEGDRMTRMVRIKKGLDNYVNILETIAKKYPWQWYNFYDFWDD